MSTPSDKSPEVAHFLDKLSFHIHGRSRADAIVHNQCVQCGRKAIFFKDSLSRKEYCISGLCQRCQDKVFNK